MPSPPPVTVLDPVHRKGYVTFIHRDAVTLFSSNITIIIIIMIMRKWERLLTVVSARLGKEWKWCARADFGLEKKMCRRGIVRRTFPNNPRMRMKEKKAVTTTIDNINNNNNT